LSGNEGRSGPRGPGALRRYLTGGGRVRSVIALVVVGCAAALLLTAVTGAFATKNSDTKTNPRCIVGGCTEPGPFGYPLGADYLSEVLALPSPPTTREEAFYANFAEDNSLGGDIFAWTSSGFLEPALPNARPPDLELLDELPGAFLAIFKLREGSKDGPVVGYGTEQEMFVLTETGFQPARPSDWIVSFPGRGVLWLNSNEGGGDAPDVTLPDGSVRDQATSGPLKNGHGVIVGGSGEFTHRTGTWTDSIITEPDGNLVFELRFYWDQKPKRSKK
jgi:hypothetical protein